LEDALPKDQSLPQKINYGLLPELISGTTFTTERNYNRYSLFYRILPSNRFQEYKKIGNGLIRNDFTDKEEDEVEPGVHMFKPMPDPTKETDFVEGIITLGGNGTPTLTGCAIHGYSFNKSMKDKCFVNADGDFLIIPQQGALHVQTEFGLLRVLPKEILIIPSGLKFSVELEKDGEIAKGFIGETYHSHWNLPEHGVLGIAGLANPRHFYVPTAFYEDRECKYQVIHKSDGQLFELIVDRSPFDVVAYFGNYVPMKYELKHFDNITNGSRDHFDPSSHTVVTSPSLQPGVAVFDFIAFLPRWLVSEHTFRAVYPHRNAATEFNMVIEGGSEDFPLGCSFMSPFLSPHGIPESTIDKSINKKLEPERTEVTWLMLESGFPFKETKWAREASNRITNYSKRFESIKKRFNPNQK